MKQDKPHYTHITHKMKNGLLKAGESTKERLKKTTGEALIFALIGLEIGGGLAHNHENGRKKIPLGFSEIENVEREAERKGESLGPINIHQMKTNDLCMKVFEAYNESLEHGVFSNQSEIFASRLYDAIDYRNIYKYNLKDLLNQVPSYHPAILKELDPYLKSLPKVKLANEAFDEAWDERHHDNYHTEVRTRIVSDNEGNTSTETYTVEVYDDTDHYFTYNKKHGELGASILNQQFKEVPMLKIQENIKKTNKTNADGEYATRKSRENKGEFKIMTQEELLEAANSRYTGSTLLEDIYTIKILYPRLKEANNQRNLAKKTAKSSHYRTYSHIHSGPKEFQVAEKVLEVGQELETTLTELEKVIRETDLQIPLLKEKIKEFLEKGYLNRFDFSNKEKQKLSKEVLKLTKEIYKLNFKKGLDVDRYRWRVLVLGFMLGGIIGGGIGTGINYITNQFNFYDRINLKKILNIKK